MRRKTRNRADASRQDSPGGGRTLPRERLQVLVRDKERFLGFLERRLGSRADAEDLLQSAYLKLVDQRNMLRDDERLVPWFYQVLRNLIADHRRRRGAAARAQERVAAEAASTTSLDDELFRSICNCANDVLATLKREQADLVRRVEMDGESLHRAAEDLCITPNNASVRLHRARRALREGLQAMCGICTEHGCLDCGCRSPAASPLNSCEVTPSPGPRSAHGWPSL
jgi:RNA polymerase sigma-70 factor (ECF subfamily)